MKINFLTGNSLKFEVAKRFFTETQGYELVRRSFPTPEVQDDSCEEIARQSALFAAQRLNEPCVALDVGFFIEALGGFPGPFVKYINDWLTEAQLLRLLKDGDDRSAYFLDALAIGFPDGTAKVFTSKLSGTLAEKGEYTPSKWPANSIFIPAGSTATLGSMTAQQQADFWHTTSTNWQKLIKYLLNVDISDRPA